jgi:hypothetical protein
VDAVADVQGSRLVDGDAIGLYVRGGSRNSFRLVCAATRNGGNDPSGCRNLTDVAVGVIADVDVTRSVDGDRLGQIESCERS